MVSATLLDARQQRQKLLEEISICKANITCLLTKANSLNRPKLALILSALDIHLPQTAIAQIQPLVDNAMTAAALANDRCSYTKEME